MSKIPIGFWIFIVIPTLIMWLIVFLFFLGKIGREEE